MHTVTIAGLRIVLFVIDVHGPLSLLVQSRTGVFVAFPYG